ncbi:MAG: hypothetical protein K2M10_08770 [Muribaculaceae bacterium]|nr:hypothetical protein [Muribaculaceae bacterium]
MMQKLFISLILLAAVALTGRPADNVTKGWEQVKTETPSAGKPIVKETDIEIRTDSSAIIVTAMHPLQIKVFTILGRIVSDAPLPAGTSRLNLPAHGVYIVKAGSLTCKVAL